MSGQSSAIACGTYDVLVSQDPVAMANANSNTITYNKVLYDVNPLSYPEITVNSEYGSYNYLSCYCSSILSQNILNGFQNYLFYDKPTNTNIAYCSTQRTASYIADAVTYASTAIIIIVNQILLISLRKFVIFERLSTQTAQLTSLTMKLFIAQYVNTGLLTLIINGSLNEVGAKNYVFATSQYFKFGFFTGELFDYDVRW